MPHLNDIQQDAKEVIVAMEPCLLDLLAVVESGITAEKEQITGGLDPQYLNPTFWDAARDYHYTRKAVQTLKIIAKKGLQNDLMTNTELVDLINYGLTYRQHSPDKLWPIKNFVRDYEKELIGIIPSRISRMPNLDSAARLRLLDSIKSSIVNYAQRSNEPPGRQP